MVPDETYEICLPILQDPNLEDEDKTDKLEELLRKETTFTGLSLENLILDVLWRYRDGGGSSTSPPPIRPAILRRPSPASWRGSSTPLSGSPRLGVSPLAPPGFIPTTLGRTKSSTVSPFSSPRPSPRLAFAAPAIPHSPNLNAYEFASDTSPAPEIFSDLQTENVDWLVSDDAASVSSSVGTLSVSVLNAAAPEYVSPQQSDMTPYDMLRSILGQSKTDEEIEAALATHGPGTPELNPNAASFNYPSAGMTPPPGLKPAHAYAGPDGAGPRSRPGSRHQAKEGISAPSIDDNDAFPSLGSASSKPSKKHHGKRGGHGHGHKDNLTPSSLADIVRMPPSPAPAANRPESKRGGRNGNATTVKNGENSAAAQAIPMPKHIPWLETGDKANKAYLKARQEAIKHGGLRNKFLQSAAQAWNRNDARAAKALSLRGQSENDLMRKAHREAARELYEERNKNNSASSEFFVDLHGLHPEEAVEYLERVLLENSNESRPIYAITGTGHHSKNGKDKVGKAIRMFLNEWRYAYREFSVPGDRNSMGGILGIDARSWDKSLSREGVKDKREETKEEKEEVDILEQGVEIGDGKVRLLVRDPPKGPSGSNRGR
ncbi:hypothetical protein DL771_011848 [Monosporascus sp. 5C6A]|nr:hypothetical protein DL771_011848 [Monosporascus sp. 5C6A]